MLTALEFKYPANAFYLILAITSVTFFVLSFGKKERIIRAFRLEYKTRLKSLRSVLLGLGLALTVFSLMGPQVFDGYTEVNKSGLDIYVLIDTSKSMLVSDIKPDRITIAKKITENLLDRLDGDRIGFIPFSSGAYIQMPLTDDYGLARMFLDVIDTDMIGGGGTNLAAAVQLAADSFNRASESDRVIIILSDGEEHETAGAEVLKNITDDKLRVYTVGIGTEKGGLVPVYNDSGDSVVDYMKDSTGNPVTSRLNADGLIKLAQNGSGSYYQASLQGTEAASIAEELSALKRGNFASENVRRFKPMFQYFLAPGIILILIAWFIPERRKSS